MKAPNIMPSVSFEIDDEKYKLTLLDGITASDLFFEIVNAIGGSFSKLAAVDSAQSKDAFGMAIAGAIVSGVGTPMLVKLRKAFLESCTVVQEQSTPRLDRVASVHFAGRPAHMLLWQVMCMKENFADFLDDGFIAKIKAMIPGLAQPASPSPET